LLNKHQSTSNILIFQCIVFVLQFFDKPFINILYQMKGKRVVCFLQIHSLSFSFTVSDYEHQLLTLWLSMLMEKVLKHFNIHLYFVHNKIGQITILYAQSVGLLQAIEILIVIFWERYQIIYLEDLIYHNKPLKFPLLFNHFFQSIILIHFYWFLKL
jgi:hypothetical protein